MQNVLGLDDPNDRSGTKLVKILSSKAISDCIQDGYLSVKDKPFRNVAADIWVEYTEPEQRGRLFNLINKNK